MQYSPSAELAARRGWLLQSASPGFAPEFLRQAGLEVPRPPDARRLHASLADTVSFTFSRERILKVRAGERRAVPGVAEVYTGCTRNIDVVGGVQDRARHRWSSPIGAAYRMRNSRTNCMLLNSRIMRRTGRHPGSFRRSWPSVCGVSRSRHRRATAGWPRSRRRILQTYFR